MAESYGIPGGDRRIASFHKIWVIDYDNDIVVAGYIGEGTSKEIVSNWDTPFADSSLAAKFAIVSGAMQDVTDIRIQSGINSRQQWSGNQPYTFNVVMKFRAFDRPEFEVEGAIKALEMMMAPESKAGGLAMRLPTNITLNFGGMQILPDCCIKSMSVPLDKERDKNGSLLRADVSLQIETRQTLTRTDIVNIYPSTDIN